ncbi:MAG: extracellular solute-binding protein, partial [Candidatus Moraniibacteriota bacterium]
LEVWGVFDDTDAYQEVFSKYQEINPFIRQITYRKLSPETYKEDLLSAMASGKGPDIFMMGNTWLDGFKDKIVPAPETLASEKEVRDGLVDVVAEDFIPEDKKVYALPLSVDSLGLYYNRDLLNAAGISAPPTTWEELNAMIPRLTHLDQFGNLRQSAIALGTAYNVNRSTDILLSLAYQRGATFDANSGFNDLHMVQAFGDYTQYALSGSSLYTWNPRQHFSIDAFYEGTAAMMVNYSWHYQTIKQKNAKFNFSVSPLPQFAGSKPVNFANYWAFAVAKNKSLPEVRPGELPTVPSAKYQEIRANESWQLLRYLALPHSEKAITIRNFLAGTSRNFAVPSDPALAYLTKTGKPAARRDLIDTEKGDVKLAPFALGNLIARSWKPGNPEAVETILAEGIDSVNKGERGASEALSVIQNRFIQFRSQR